jgi:hypothetical protein
VDSEYGFHLIGPRVDSPIMGLGNFTRDIQAETQAPVAASFIWPVLATLKRIKNAL